MCTRRCTLESYIDFLVATPAPAACAEASRVQPHSPTAPALDSFYRLLNELKPDPEEFWHEAKPLVDKNKGVLVLNGSTFDKRRSKHISLVTRHWSGKHSKVIRGINLITLLWTDGDRIIPVDSRLFSKADGLNKHDHFWEMMLMARGRDFTSKCVLVDGWYASLENFEQIRDFGWHWLTRLRGNRVVSLEDRINRPLATVAISSAGTVLHLRGYGLVKVFRIDAPDGGTEYWATDDLEMVPGMRRQYAEPGYAIEHYHRDLKQSCEVEKCQVRSERAQRNHIGLSIPAFLWLERHFFTTGVSVWESNLRLIREAVRAYLCRPFIMLPRPPTA